MRMSNQQVDKVEITKEDLRRVRWRWYFLGEASWNYEKMQGLGYCYAMMPVLKKLYPKKEELIEALETHTQFFNTHQEFAEIILGIDCAMEEKDGAASLPAVSSIKTGLMGPLAGIGDTLFGVIANTVIFSIGSYMALQGNPIGVFVYLLWGLVRMLLRGQFMQMGYRQGVKIVTSMGERLNQLAASASVLGVTVVGALIPSVISANVPFVFHSGDVELEIQSVLDQILPALIPVTLVAFLYWLLGKRGMTSFKAIILVMVIGVVLSLLGVLG